MRGSRKYPYSPHRRDWKFQGGGGVSRTHKFLKAMYGAKLEFPEGRGIKGQSPSVGGGGMDIFWNHTIIYFKKENNKCTCPAHYTVLSEQSSHFTNIQN